MKDTSERMAAKYRDTLLARSGEERLKMGCSMHATARALIIASMRTKSAGAITRGLFLRFYGDDCGPKERKKILRVLREAVKTQGMEEISVAE